VPEFVSPFASAVTGNRLRPFPSAPLRTARESFDLKRLASGLCFDSQDRFGVSHLAYLDVRVVRPPVSLRPVAGFPDLRLLWRLRDRGARAR
jgi:hypothetical protein